jgi:hypothetical protein
VTANVTGSAAFLGLTKDQNALGVASRWNLSALSVLTIGDSTSAWRSCFALRRTPGKGETYPQLQSGGARSRVSRATADQVGELMASIIKFEAEARACFRKIPLHKIFRNERALRPLCG